MDENEYSLWKQVWGSKTGVLSSKHMIIWFPSSLEPSKWNVIRWNKSNANPVKVNWYVAVDAKPKKIGVKVFITYAVGDILASLFLKHQLSYEAYYGWSLGLKEIYGAVFWPGLF